MPPIAAPPSHSIAPHALAAMLNHDACRMAMVDARGRVKWASRAFEALLGRKPGACEGRALDALLGHPTPSLSVQWTKDPVIRGFEWQLRRNDDSAPWLQLDSTPLQDGSGHLVTLADVSERKRLAADNTRLTELLDMAQDFGRMGVWERDVATLKGRWDQHVFRFWGLPEGDGTPDFAAAAARIHPEDRAPERFLASLAKAGSYSVRYRVMHDDGSLRRIHSHWRVIDGPNGKPARVLGILLDDTDAFDLARSFEDANAQLQLAVDLADIAISRHDLKTKLVHCNERGYKLLEIPLRDEPITLREMRERLHPDDLPAMAASVRETLRSGGPTGLEARFRRSDGGWRTLLTRRVLQRDTKGEPLACLTVALDVTERVEQARRAMDLARRLEAAAESARIGLWSTSFEDTAPEWNARMYELFGLQASNAPLRLGEWLRRCVHPEDRERVAQGAVNWFSGSAAPAEDEFRIVRPDGTVRWVLVRGNGETEAEGRHRFFGVVMDVTEQHDTMENLRDAARRSSLAARGAGIGTWEHVPADGGAIWDDQMFRLGGLEPALEAPSLAQRMAAIHPDDREEMRRMMAPRTPATKSSTLEFRIVWPDGTVRWLASRSSSVFDDEGRETRRIGVNWDITDIKHAEIAQRDRELALRESRAKSKFLSRMSHELRTPLNAVLGFTQLLQTDAADADPQQRLRRLEHIRAAGTHLLALINDVLDLSSLEGGELRLELQPVALEGLVLDTLPLVDALAREHGVQIELGPLDGGAFADPTRLRQVLLNLLSNAIKYNRPGGSVTVDAQRRDDDIFLRVTDSGRGIEPQRLNEVFEPFNRLGVEQDGIEGTGIGLTIVKTIVERMGGDIAVSSRVGVGSVFAVRLAFASTGNAPLWLPTEPSALGELPADGAARPCLLYIEDNPVNVLVVGELVSRRPEIDFQSAGDGTSGVAIAREMRPRLILVDMQLPDFDGHEVLRRLRADAATASIPCIALSANAMPEDIERALAAGFNDYWTKPVDFRAFMSGLDRLFGRPAARAVN